MSARRMLVLAVAAALGAVACGDRQDTTAPEIRAETRPPGTLAVKLEAVDDSAGFLLLTVTGGPVDSVTAACGCSVDTDLADTTRVFVAGYLARNGDVARVYIPQGGNAAAYRVTVEQVANRISYVRLGPAAYRASLAAMAP